MFDPSRLLGALVQGAITSSLGGNSSHRRRHRSSSGFSSQMSGAVGMGILGLAVGAFEHYQKTSASQAGAAQASAGNMQQPMPPPIPSGSASMGSVRATPPPPPPSSMPATPAPATVLIRAMLSAANADGAIDAEERNNILGRISALGLSTEEQKFLESEMNTPLGLPALLQQVRKVQGGAEFSEQIYIASILALRVDSEAEHKHLAQLAYELGLTPERAQALEQMISNQ